MGITPWAAVTVNQLEKQEYEVIHACSFNRFQFEIYCIIDSVWINITYPKGQRLLLRSGYSPGAGLEIEKVSSSDSQVSLKLKSDLGAYRVTVDLPESKRPLLHYTVTFKAYDDLFIPFWPRDIVVPDDALAGQVNGKVYANQIGARSGIIYAGFEKPSGGAFLYFQNLTALNDYCQTTETSVAGTVAGQWPELGFTLPQTKDKPLPAGQEFVLMDAFVAFSEHTPADQFEMSRQYINLLAEIYKQLPRPETKYHDYPDILDKSLKDLETSKGCWAHRTGHDYVNAYVSDYTSPPEIMVQLAVLLPLYDYEEWSGKKCKITQVLHDGLPTFYNEKLGTIMRWLPAAENMLDGSEIQKNPDFMDAWYLHHPLLNLSRMALSGDEMAKDLFLKSTEYAIKVAQHFNYVWPVFYKMDTLEVVRAETAPGKGGEKDVAGVYVHILLQAWDLTKDKKYLEEAEKAAQSLLQFGFDVFYQANNVAFASGAMLRLYKETKNELYLNLSYLFIANLLKNVSLWECNYGYGKHFPAFFALFPLYDAPYTAVYEEQEGFSAIHDYFMHAQGVDILPSITLLLAEFIRYAVSRAVYYYPPMLPLEMLSKKVQSGEVDHKLWIALEDIHDGWEQSGSVGQEVYGAGLAFGIVPRHYIGVPGEAFMIFIDYPTENIKVQKGKVSFKVLGHPDFTCSLRVINTGDETMPEFHTKANKKQQQPIITKKSYSLYHINGNREITINWG